jgi:ribosome-binding protein aMBF1 (putative translation factor)
MFNIQHDTKDIYIGKSLKMNTPIKHQFNKKQTEDDNFKPPKLITKEIALKIQKKRNELKMTQKELAQRINKNVTVIQEIELATAKYDRNILNKLERVLNIKL